jgi:tetratricopeptide (TPR) repeat protein
MALRFLSATVIGAVLAAAVVAAAPARAEDSPEGAPAPDWVAPPSDLPRPERGDRTFDLDTLFGALKIAPDAESAKAIEDRIWSLWMVSGSDTCNLLMGRVKAAADEKDYDLAIKLLDAVIELKPGYVEAWNRRATVYFMQKDYGHALADIR